MALQHVNAFDPLFEAAAQRLRCGPTCFQKKDLPDLRAGEDFRWPFLVWSDHGLCSGVQQFTVVPIDSYFALLIS